MRDKTYLSASLVFAGLTAAFLIAVSYTSVESKIGQALALLSGMTAMGALTYFQRYVENGNKASTVDISFNETFLSTSIAESFKRIADQTEIREQQQYIKHLPWDLTPSQLVGVDNALALARLRIDLEAELRRIAHEEKINLSDRPLGTVHLARELSAGKVLPAEFLEPLKEVSDMCSRAIHGEVVSDELAASVVRIGNQLLDRLRLLPRQNVKDRLKAL